MTSLDSTARAMHAHALNGSPRKHAQSRKYTVGTTSVTIMLPTWTYPNGETHRPNYLKFTFPVEADAVYISFDRLASAVVPLTSADGDEQLFSGDIIALHDRSTDRIALIAEANTTVTISYIWT